MITSRRISVSINDQKLQVMEGDILIREFAISTAAKGMGFTPGSLRTPTGRFRITEKIGEDQPSGMIFKGRVPIRPWTAGDGCHGDLILSRILRLDGLDEKNANTLARFVYIHGTNQEEGVGTPGSHGCVRLGNADMIELTDLVEVGTEVEILPATRKRGKLLFMDCDSTLSTIEGIDELAHVRGKDVFDRVVSLTNAAMNGEVPLNEVFPRRMEMIEPNRETCAEVARRYRETVVPGVAELIQRAKEDGWIPVILSGGFAPLIQPLAHDLGIAHIEAVPLYLNDDGSYQGYGSDYPTTRNLGKNEVIRQWKEAMLPERVVMMGDGISDLETKPEVDHFIGFGGVVARPKVREGCDQWLTDMSNTGAVMDMINGKDALDQPV